MKTKLPSHCPLCKFAMSGPHGRAGWNDKWGMCTACVSTIGRLTNAGLEDPRYFELYKARVMVRYYRLPVIEEHIDAAEKHAAYSRRGK